MRGNSTIYTVFKVGERSRRLVQRSLRFGCEPRSEMLRRGALGAEATCQRLTVELVPALCATQGQAPELLRMLPERSTVVWNVSGKTNGEGGWT